MDILRSVGEYFGKPQQICIMYSVGDSVQIKGSPLLVTALDNSNFTAIVDQLSHSDSRIAHQEFITKPRMPTLERPLNCLGVRDLREILTQILAICLDGIPKYGGPAPEFWPQDLPFGNPRSKASLFGNQQGEKNFLKLRNILWKER